MTLALTITKHFINGIPDALHARVSAATCNHLLRGQKFRHRLSELEGKRLQLTITDTNTSFQLYFHNNCLFFDNSHKRSDIHIRGKLTYLIQLAMRQEDPDTLFFSRQLSIEGNTEDALLLKNFLDAVEFDSQAHLQAWLGIPMAKQLNPVIQKLQPEKYIHKIINTLSS